MAGTHGLKEHTCHSEENIDIVISILNLDISQNNEYFEEYSDSGNDSENEVLDDEEDDPDFGEEGEGASGSHIGDQLGLGDDEYTYDCLSTENIVSHMVKTIKEVNSVIQIPATTVRLLLNHFKWDKEKLMEKYYSEDQEAMFKEAKITSPFKKITLGKPGSTVSSHTCECEICYLTLPRSMMNGLDCGHFYCTSCWSEYLTTKIMDEGASQMIQCPGSCDMLVDDQTVMKLVTDQRIFKVVPGCELHQCCTQSWHDPVRCHLIKKWIKKCDDDSETSHWISANTKECPKCLATIEKDGGCNHMICKNQSCKTEFCWVCMGPWDPHGSSWYSCNRYDEDEARTARQGQEKSRYALQRYLFYCNRYMNHHQSLKFESKLYCMVKGKMDEMQQHNMSWIEVQFLRKAVDILCECRRTLMYTYVFAFYLKKNNQSEIFEDNQKDLEKSTEDFKKFRTNIDIVKVDAKYFWLTFMKDTKKIGGNITNLTVNISCKNKQK
ncbi:ARIH1 [Lepeophtheirus salmonis]|uniref:RBR-type E3 ubiquitin transferase n=1 Tax=Lepeophtheirus salmonis TaxID=72036 RepID=A0A7R8CSG2_LEPSM|nr:ARIH1 [Lepeophtheirus salmonis]CAF2914616.1 ARIH1 [Lepeophtheirus salmonis]